MGLILMSKVQTLFHSNHSIVTDVLHVPNLSCNLLSMSKLTRDLNCLVYFTPSTCIFQDQISRKRIGSADAISGLYYFRHESIVSHHVKAAGEGWDSSLSCKHIFILYSRLGHPNLLYLRRLFLSLFQNNDPFKCEICQLVKIHVFLSIPIHVSLFCSIHSDIWDLLKCVLLLIEFNSCMLGVSFKGKIGGCTNRLLLLFHDQNAI